MNRMEKIYHFVIGSEAWKKLSFGIYWREVRPTLVQNLKLMGLRDQPRIDWLWEIFNESD